MLDQARIAAQGGVTLFAPHPDDEVFGCGGLIALLTERGITVQVVIVSDGGFGHFGRDPSARKEESRAAAAILGYELIEFWDYPDQGLDQTIELSDRIKKKLRDTQHSLVLAPSPWEVHPDHLAVCKAVNKAIISINTEPPPSHIALWYYEIGTPMPRSHIVDITDVADRKAKAMACFETQLAIQDYARQFVGLNTYRGYNLPRFGALGEAYFAPSLQQISDGSIEQLPPPTESSPGYSIHAPTQAFEQKIAAQTAEIAALTAERDTLYRSKSWRITAPLRYVSKTIQMLAQPRKT